MNSGIVSATKGWMTMPNPNSHPHFDHFELSIATIA